MNRKNLNGYGYMLIVDALICAITYAALTMWSAMASDIGKEFMVSKSMLSLGASFFVVGYAVGNFIESWIGAKYGYCTAGCYGLGIMLVGTVGLFCASSFKIILGCRFLQGFGVLWGIANNSIIACVSRDRRGVVSGIVGGSLFLGIGSGSFLGTFLLRLSGSWRKAFGIYFMIVFFITVLWIFTMRKSTVYKGLHRVGI